MDKLPKSQMDIPSGFYNSPEEQCESIRQRVERDGYAVDGNDPMLVDWTEVSIPEGFNQIPMRHTTDGRSQPEIIIWNPETAEVKELSLNVYAGIQKADKEKCAQLENDGWKLIGSGRYLEGRYEERYYFRPKNKAETNREK